jgi:hypothetical protein
MTGYPFSMSRSWRSPRRVMSSSGKIRGRCAAAVVLICEEPTAVKMLQTVVTPHSCGQPPNSGSLWDPKTNTSNLLGCGHPTNSGSLRGDRDTRRTGRCCGHPTNSGSLRANENEKGGIKVAATPQIQRHSGGSCVTPLPRNGFFPF